LTVEKYIPTIRKEKVLDIQGTDYESKLDSIMDKTGFIKTRLNEEVIIQAVSHKLYKDPESGLRELYNNEAYHGCLVAKTKHNVKNPYIKVSLNTTTRKLIIQGFNSLGITEEVFTEILTELGTSGNRDRTKTGKFGMGFASYTKLSDIMILETECINGDCYAVLAKGGLGFQKLPKPKLEKTGTRLTLTLRKDVDYEKLVTMLSNLGMTSGIKTYFELESPKKINEYSSGLNTVEQLSYKQIFDNTNTASSQDYSYLKSSLVNDEVEVHLSLAVDSNGSLKNIRNKKFYLCNSPIEVLIDEDSTSDKAYNLDEDENPEEYKLAEQERDNYKTTRIDEIEFATLVVNMKDEDLFEPMQDRERTTKEAEKRLRKIIIDLYNETLKKIKPCESLESWFNHEHKYFISSSEADIVSILDDKSKTVQKFLNTKVMEYELDGRIKYDTHSLKDIIEKSKNYFYINKKDKRVTTLIEDNFEDFFLVMVHPDKEPFWEEKTLYNDTIKTLKYFKFNEAKQYCKDHDFKAKRVLGEKEDRTSEDVVLHYSGTNNSYSGYGHSETYGEYTKTVRIGSESYKDFKENIIQVAPFSCYRDVLKQFRTDYYLASEKKNLDAQTLIELQKNLKEKFAKWESNHEFVTLEKILKYKKVMLNFECFDNSHENSTKGLSEIPKNTLYIVGGSKSLFELALILIYNGVDYEITNESLDSYYKPKVKALEKTLKLIAQDLYEGKFDDIFSYEVYLLKVRDFEIKVQDPILRKLFKLSHDTENLKEITNDILTLNEKYKTEKPVINRKESEYIS